MKTLRLWMMCWLALAVPLQGMAAVSQMFCHGPAAVAVSHAVTQTPPTQAHRHAHHDHDAQTATHAHAHGSTSNDVSSDLGNANTNAKLNHTCSTCAQCCVGVALLPAPVVLALGQPDHTLVASRVVLLGEGSPNNLERPPRTFLA